MTAKTEPKERTLSWLPTPAGWTLHPKCRKLRKADRANPDRWMHVVDQAHKCKAKGRLVMPDGTPLELEDLAHDLRDNEEEWVAFVDLAKELELLRIDPDGAIVVIHWAHWNREAAHEMEREEGKYKKRSQRAEAKLEELQQDKEDLSRQLAEVRAHLSSPVPTLSQPVQSVPDLSRPRLEETRLDLDKTREEVSPRERDALTHAQSPRPAKPLPSAIGLTGKEFHPRIQAIYQILAEACGKPRRLPDKEALVLPKRLREEPWVQLGEDFGAIATAIELGVARTLDAIGTGEAVDEPWLDALDAAEECIPEALAHVQAVEEARALGLPPPELRALALPDEMPRNGAKR